MSVYVTNLEKSLNAVSPERVKKVTRIAMQRTLRSGEAAAKKKIREEYNIKLKDISQKMKSFTYSQAEGGEIIARSARLPIIMFSPRIMRLKKGKRSVSVEIKKGQRKLVRYGFPATMPTGHKGIFSRIPGTQSQFAPISKRTGRQWKREKITELKTVGVAQMFGAQRVIVAVQKRIQDIWERELAGAMRYAK